MITLSELRGVTGVVMKTCTPRANFFARPSSNQMKGTKEPLIHPPGEAPAGARNIDRGFRLFRSNLIRFRALFASGRCPLWYPRNP
jgi:hypothetical protein